jgi:hypothetical protein
MGPATGPHEHAISETTRLRKSQKGFSCMLLSRFVSLERAELIAEAKGDEIVVRTLGFFAAYAIATDAPQLIALWRWRNGIAAGKIRAIDRERVRFIVRTIVHPPKWPDPENGAS